MRSCTKRTSRFAAVVMIEHDVTGSSPSFGRCGPQAGERKQLPFGQAVIERLAGLFGVFRLLPLVVAIGDDQRPVRGGLHQWFPRAGGCELVVAGIDQRRAATQLRPRGRDPNRARIACRSPLSPLTTASTGWVGAMFVRPSARSAVASEIVMLNRAAIAWGFVRALL
jgi:hypothetical protein